jgi:hypothetical protein
MVPTRLIVTVQIEEARVAGFSLGRQASNWSKFKPAVDYILDSGVSLTQIDGRKEELSMETDKTG